jgi:hypothetical protein
MCEPIEDGKVGFTSAETDTASVFINEKGHGPYWTPVSQQLLHKAQEERRYDVLTIRLKSGEVKERYFDITAFFGKFQTALQGARRFHAC